MKDRCPRAKDFESRRNIRGTTCGLYRRELPAMVLIDSISRQIPAVSGKYESLEEERVSSSEVYTRPEVLKYKGKNYKVPKVLLSGNHAERQQRKQRSKI